MIPKDVLAQWNLSGKPVRIGGGLINDTYRVANWFVLQRINDRVFTDPYRLFSNYETVYKHIRGLVPQLLPAASGELCFTDARAQIWRCMTYYPSRSFQSLPDELVFSAGEAFGFLLQRLSTCDAPLTPVIPNFHNFCSYWEELEQVWSTSEEQLIGRDLIERCRQNANQRTSYGRCQVIHGDCKVNNLLFHRSKNTVVRIVDIDTFMWGRPEWDFGDLVRSIATESESNDHLKHRLDSVCRGFFQQYPISKDEVPQFFRAPGYMSLMLGIRFLTDHIRGNRYFKVLNPGENKDRACRHFDLARFFDALEPELHATILSSLGCKA